MKTYYPKTPDIQRKWHLIDLKGKVLGRVSSEIAKILLGKTKAIYEPSVDTGDFIVAINADQIKLTGNKLTDKIYYWHTGAIGGVKEITAEKQLKKDSRDIIKMAVQGMLPKNTLGRNAIKKLKIYKGDQHDQQAQQPEPLAI